MECIFTLKYDVGEQRCDPDALVERLGTAGCTDALVGMGEPGYLALEFSREADSVESAVRAALVCEARHHHRRLMISLKTSEHCFRNWGKWRNCV